MKKIRVLAIGNLAFLLLHILFSYGTQLAWFGPDSVGDVSDRYNSLFTPAGFTFSIWGLIYLSLLACCIRQIIYAFRYAAPEESNQEVLRTGPWFMLNNLLAAIWVYTWVNGEIPTATVLIFGQLLALIIIHTRLGIHERLRSPGSKIFTQGPLSIYLGWLVVASVANTAVYLLSINWDGSGMDFTQETWTRIMVITAAVICSLVVLLRRNILVGLVLLWALWGIRSKHQGNELGDLQTTLWYTTIGVSAVCIIQLLFNLLAWRKTMARKPAGN